MTDLIDTTTAREAKRQEIKDRINAAQERNDERGSYALLDTVSEKALQARDGVTDFARKHPVATVAGGVALGVLVSAMFKNSPTRKAGRYAGAKAAGMAALGSEIALAFAQQVMDASASARQAGSDRFEDLSDSLVDTARSVKRQANFRVGSANDVARNTARDLGKSIARTFRRP